MSHGLIVVPRSLRMFNENTAPISLPPSLTVMSFATFYLTPLTSASTSHCARGSFTSVADISLSETVAQYVTGGTDSNKTLA
jgi:hypothetical protein